MAGHSKFKNIMHRKGAQDKKRSGMFSKLSREITVAAKMGLPDPDMNPRLRAAVNAAKAQSMPKDNIQRAIDKASKGDTENYEEIRYEGFGPGGVSLIIEALSDNRNRTATNVRTAVSKNGGNLGASGSVSHAFDRLRHCARASSASLRVRAASPATWRMSRRLVAVSRSSAARRSASFTVRTLWPSFSRASQTGYQICSATFSMPRLVSCSRSTSRSLEGASSPRP